MANKNTRHKFKFSFVMPVYNVERYLDEAVKSILAQSMDFEKNVEIIFINDGSTDSSEDICIKYQKKYPNNVKYIKQENLGVSAARNTGIDIAQGKYLSFLDADDILSPDALELSYQFLEKHHEEIDFVAIKMKFFGASTGDHMLNYKFSHDRVVDIYKDFESIQLSSSSTFIKSSTIKELNIRYAPGIKYSEDSRFLTEILLRRGKYGVLQKPTYYYRKRYDFGSAIGGSAQNKDWYLVTPESVYLYLIRLSQNIAGETLRYIQYLIAYDLQWRYRQTTQSTLSNKELTSYKSKLKRVLRYIDDDIILAQKNISIQHKMFILSQKHGQGLYKDIKKEGLRYTLNGQLIYNYRKSMESVQVDLIEVEDDQILIEGKLQGLILESANLYVFYNGKYYDLSTTDRPSQMTFLGEPIPQQFSFKVNLPITFGSSIKFSLIIDRYEKTLPIETHKFARLNNTVGRSYRYVNGVILEKLYSRIIVSKGSHVYRTWRELAYGLSMLKNKRVRSELFRLAYFLTKPFFRKDVWLFSDRPFNAGDNAEALFTYCQKLNTKTEKYVFTVSKKSEDYNRLKKIGKVVGYNSLKHKLLFLNAEFIISSHADDFVINAFSHRESSLSDLYSFDFIFLQHGITHHDISGWLNKHNKNIKLFITSSKKEYDSILNDGYGYNKTEVVLTGMPRYDMLTKSKVQNRVIIAPTWRRNIAIRSEVVDGRREYISSFKETEYYKFFRDLMTNKRFQEALRSRGMKAEFYLHPAFSNQSDDFQAAISNGNLVEVKTPPYNYKEAFSKGSILLTDYSSVAFDFAYLFKPVLYSQFDKKNFYKVHTITKPGYFSYETDGFGPVTYNLESTIDALVRTIMEGSKMEGKYKQRVRRFFYKTDKNNSERVYKEIVKLKNKKIRI